MTHYSDKSGDPREPAWISDRTKIKVSIVGVLAICCSIIASTWAARGYLENWKNELSEHFTAVERTQMRIAADIAETRQSLGSKWTENQMILWSAQLDKLNRTVKRNDSDVGLLVPDPSTIRQRP